MRNPSSFKARLELSVLRDKMVLMVSRVVLRVLRVLLVLLALLVLALLVCLAPLVPRALREPQVQGLLVPQVLRALPAYRVSRVSQVLLADLKVPLVRRAPKALLVQRGHSGL